MDVEASFSKGCHSFFQKVIWLGEDTCAPHYPSASNEVKAFTAQITARTTWKLKNGQPRWVHLGRRFVSDFFF